MQRNESYDLMPYYSQANVVRLLAERYATKPNVKFEGFRFPLKLPTFALNSCDTTKQSSSG